MRGPRIDGDRRPQRPRQTFEARFGNMMVVGAIERGDVQRHRGVHGEGLEPFLHQFGVERSDFVAHEFGVNTRNGRPEISIATRVNASSIGTCTSA